MGNRTSVTLTLNLPAYFPLKLLALHAGAEGGILS